MKKNTKSLISYFLLLTCTTTTARRIIPRDATQPSSYGGICNQTLTITNASAAANAAAERGVPYFLYDVLNEDYLPAEGPSMS
jgi:hypothetical protein